MNKKLFAVMVAVSLVLLSVSAVFATDTPAETTAAETTAVIPGETTAATPAETTAVIPAETTVATPAETTAAIPAETTAATPAETTVATPAVTTATTTAPGSGGANSGLELPNDKINVEASICAKINKESEWPENAPGEDVELIVRKGDAVDIRVDLYMDTVIDFVEEWYQYGVDMICLATGGDSPSDQDLEFRAMLLDFFNFLPIMGDFTVTVKSSQTIGLPDEYVQIGEMEGFNEEARALFTETNRSFTGKTLTIDFSLREGITMGELMENLDRYFSYMSLTLEGIDVGAVSGTCRMQGRLKGGVVFQVGIEEDDQHTVRLETDTLVTKVTMQKEVGDAEEDDEEKALPEKRITFKVDGDASVVEPIYTYGEFDAEALPIPTKPGYRFDGWYTNSKMTKKVGDTLNVRLNMTLYGTFVRTTPLEMDAHYAYIFGYPNGTICPDNPITREEVSMIFYRLLQDSVREELLSKENVFTDVAADRWSNTAISTMVKGGFVSGRSATKFDPEAYITRAELVTMATRFVELPEATGVQFSDLTGHWAESYVQKATAAGWISGYPNGTFKPDANVTRAEAMALINRMLSRSVAETDIHADAKIWSDITPGDWKYSVILEATNSHAYQRKEDGTGEIWSAILENKTWN